MVVYSLIVKDNNTNWKVIAISPVINALALPFNTVCVKRKIGLYVKSQIQNKIITIPKQFYYLDMTNDDITLTDPINELDLTKQIYINKVIDVYTTHVNLSYIFGSIMVLRYLMQMLNAGITIDVNNPVLPSDMNVEHVYPSDFIKQYDNYRKFISCAELVKTTVTNIESETDISNINTIYNQFVTDINNVVSQ